MCALCMCVCVCVGGIILYCRPIVGLLIFVDNSVVYKYCVYFDVIFVDNCQLCGYCVYLQDSAKWLNRRDGSCPKINYLSLLLESK